MISIENTPLNTEASNVDFTIDSYHQLLTLAKRNYVFVTYDAIPWGKRFILWRHDCDFSLNRARVLAEVETSYGVHATYFLNLHSEYYNLFERDQYYLVREILKMGHNIGLHFDASYYEISTEQELANNILKETNVLESLYGTRPLVFSFHNPVAAHMSCENELYGGLINCYSRRFKTEVPYCSDSNGYWRFRRLRDVLTHATDPCLQVLTHPGWWQDVPMSPRERIFRSVYGRAGRVMSQYDEWLETHRRENISDVAERLLPIKQIDKKSFDLCDLLWNRGDFPTLFMELWRVHERYVRQMLKAFLLEVLRDDIEEIERLFQDMPPVIDGMSLIEIVFEINRTDTFGEAVNTHRGWLYNREQLTKGLDVEASVLEQGSVYLCSMIGLLYDWLSAMLQTTQEISINGTEDNLCKERRVPAVHAKTEQQWRHIIRRLGDTYHSEEFRRDDEGGH